MEPEGVTGVGHVLRAEAEARGEEVTFGVEVAVGGVAGWGWMRGKVWGGYGRVGGAVVGRIGGGGGRVEG